MVSGICPPIIRMAIAARPATVALRKWMVLASASPPDQGRTPTRQTIRRTPG